MSRQSSTQSQNNMLLHLDQSQLSVNAPMSQRSQAPSQQTNASKQTIKEETRDILEKFSQLMLEELSSKLAA